MSVGSIWLCVVWVLQAITSRIRGERLTDRVSHFIRSRHAVLISVVYVLPLAGMLWTEDVKHGMWDLRMKLPILFLPFVLLTLDRLSANIYRLLSGVFLTSLIFAVTYCLFIYWQIIPKPFNDVREISVFISHIRFSLLIVTGLIICFYFGWKSVAGKVLCVLLSFYFITFLIILSSITGLLVLLAVLIYFVLSKLRSANSPLMRIGAVVIPLVTAIVIAWLSWSNYVRYTTAPSLNWEALPKTTALGANYNHHPEMPLVEDGHYVFTFLAAEEMASAWMEVSNVHPDSLDAGGNVISGTLIRYLASKGLTKDHAGVMQLNNDDIKHIESGIANSADLQKGSLHKRFDNILFELSVYKSHGNPSGHSVLQRLEFWRAGLGIFKKNMWIGVGTGDTKSAFKEEYANIQTQLTKKYQLRAHNQYLTMFLTYGIVGGLYFIVVMFYPFFDKRKTTLTVMFGLVAALAMFTEDTLESQAGVMFYVVFSIFLGLIVANKNDTQ